MLEDKYFSEKETKNDQDQETSNVLLADATIPADPGQASSTKTEQKPKSTKETAGGGTPTTTKLNNVSALALDLYEKYHSPQATQKAQLSKLSTDTDKLISETKKLADDPKKNAEQIINNYRSVLSIQKKLYGSDDKIIASVLNRFNHLNQENTDSALRYRDGVSGMIRLLDRLAFLSNDRDSTAYRKEALKLTEITAPNNSIALGTRHLALSVNYAAQNNVQENIKHFQLANDYWRVEPPASVLEELHAEKLGDDQFKEKHYSEAAAYYSQTLHNLERQLKTIVPPEEPLPINLRQTRLHAKIGDANLKESDSLTADNTSRERKIKTLHTAAQEYETSRSMLDAYSLHYGAGMLLPEQLTVLAASILTEVKLAQIGEKDEDHLAKATELLKDLSAVEFNSHRVNLFAKDDHYGQYDPCLIPAFQQIVDNYSLNIDKKTDFEIANNYREIIRILDRIYGMQIGQADGIDKRGETLGSIAAVYKNTKQPERAAAIESVQKAIWAENNYDTNDPRLLTAIREASDLCAKTQLHPYAVRLLNLEEKILSGQSNSTDKRLGTLQRLSNVYFSLERPDDALASIKKAVQLVEAKYGKNEERLLSFLQRVADSDHNPVVHKFAAQLLERIYASPDAKSTQARIQALQLISSEYKRSGDNDKAADSIVKLSLLADNDYTRNDAQRSIAILSDSTIALSELKAHSKAAELLDRLYEIQTNQRLKLVSKQEKEKNTDERISTLLKAAAQYALDGSKNDLAMKRSDLAIELTTQTYGGDSQSATDIWRNTARQYSVLGAHENAVAVLERFNAIQTAQGKSTEERIKTLKEITDECFLSKDSVNQQKGIQTYEQIVQMISRDKSLNRNRLLALSPVISDIVVSTNNYLNIDKIKIPAEIQLTNNLYALGNVLKKAADLLNTDGSTQAAFDNYLTATRCFGKALAREMVVNTDVINNMVSMSDIQARYQTIIKPTASTEFSSAIENLNDNIADLVNKDPRWQDRSAFPVLEKLADFYMERSLFRQALPIIKQEMSIAKDHPLPNKETNIIQLAKIYEQYAEANIGIREFGAASVVYKDLLKLANETYKGQDNDISLRVLHNISAVLQTLGAEDKDDDIKKDALKYKETEIDMANRMPKTTNEDRASLIAQKGQILLSLDKDGSDKNISAKALDNFRTALNLEEKGQLLRDFNLKGQILALLIKLERHSETVDILRSSLAKQKRNGQTDLIIPFRIQIAALLEKQQKGDQAENELEAVSQLAETIAYNADKKSVTSEINAKQLALVDQQLGAMYFKHKKFALAESTYRKLDQVLSYIVSDSPIDSAAQHQQCWLEIAKCCDQQGKTKEAFAARTKAEQYSK